MKEIKERPRCFGKTQELKKEREARSAIEADRDLLQLAHNTLAARRQQLEEAAKDLLENSWRGPDVALALYDKLRSALAPDQGREMPPRPKIVCLCGSTRFKEAFDEANYLETMAGNIVLSVGFYMHASGNKHGEGIGATPEQKIALDVLHKRKIDLADEVFVLNVGGYIGESTRSEIDHALAHGKPVRYLEPIGGRETCRWTWEHVCQTWADRKYKAECGYECVIHYGDEPMPEGCPGCRKPIVEVPKGGA